MAASLDDAVIVSLFDKIHKMRKFQPVGVGTLSNH